MRPVITPNWLVEIREYWARLGAGSPALGPTLVSPAVALDAATSAAVPPLGPVVSSRDAGIRALAGPPDEGDAATGGDIGEGLGGGDTL